VVEAIGLRKESKDVIEFVEGLTLSGDYAGKEFILREWQKEIIRKIFDTRLEDGRRQYTDCGIWLPRKNAKTELAAAICCYFLFCKPIEGEIYSAASEREQAGIIFKKIQGMVEANYELKKRCKVIATQKRIVHNTTGTIFASISSDSASKHGYNPSVVVADEIHCWKRRDLWTALTTGSDTRAERLFLSITTAGPYEPESLEGELYDYACKVRDGTVDDPTYLPIIYEAKKGDHWLDEEVWRRVNPALGDFRSLEAMQRLAERAKVNTRLENDFRRLYLNEHTQQVTRWLNMDKWNDCRQSEPIEEGGIVFGGLDLAATTDIAAWCIIAHHDGGYKAQWKFFIPEERMRDIEHNDRVPYSQWVREGYVIATPGGTIDYNIIHDEILKDAERYVVEFVGYDPWNASATASYLEAEGMNLVRVSQGIASLTEATKELERCVLDGSLEHQGNPVTNWMAANIECYTDSAGNLRPVKPKHSISGASTKKIDGIVAAIMGIKLAMTQEPQGSFDNISSLWSDDE